MTTTTDTEPRFAVYYGGFLAYETDDYYAALEVYRGYGPYATIEDRHPDREVWA